MPRIAGALAMLLTAVTCIGFNIARYPMVSEMVAESGGLAPLRQAGQPTAVEQSSVAFESAAAPESAAEAESEPMVAAAAPGASRKGTAHRMRFGSTVREPISRWPADPGEDAFAERAEIAAFGAADWEPGDPGALRRPRAEPTSKPQPPEAERDIESARGPSRAPATGVPANVVDGPAQGPTEISPSKRDASRSVVRSVSLVRAPWKGPTKTRESNPLILERPLVAVRPSSPASDMAAAAELAASERRLAVAEASSGRTSVRPLPPVDQVWNVPGANREPLLPDDVITIYPTTGVE
jgi:hypothetical protein